MSTFLYIILRRCFFLVQETLDYARHLNDFSLGMATDKLSHFQK